MNKFALFYSSTIRITTNSCSIIIRNLCYCFQILFCLAETIFILADIVNCICIFVYKCCSIFNSCRIFL